MATVCQTCGNEGFVEALVYCDSCKIGAVHRYCCGITPVPIDDYITWFCPHCDGSDTCSDCKEVDQSVILKKSEKKKKKKKKNTKGSNYTPLGLDVDYHELQDTSNVESVEVSSSPPIIEKMEEPERREISGSGKSNELTVLVRDEASVSEAGDGASVLEKTQKETQKKKKKKTIRHSLPVLAVEDHVLQATRNVESVVLSSPPNLETMKEADRRKGSGSRKSNELNGLVRNEASVLEAGDGASVSEKSEKETKKKKKKKTIRHSLPVLAVEDHVLQGTSNVTSDVASSPPNLKTMNESDRRKVSGRGNSNELNGLVRNEASVLEAGDGASVSVKSEKETKKKKKTIRHCLPVLAVEDNVLQGTSGVASDVVSSTPNLEIMKESDRRKVLGSGKSNELNGLVRNEASVLEAGDVASVSEKSEKEKKKKKKSIRHSLPVLAVEDHVLQGTSNVASDAASSLPNLETTKESDRREVSGCGKSNELNGLVRNEASVLEAGDGVSVSEKSEKEKKKKKKSIRHSLPDLAVEDHVLQATSNVESVALSSPPDLETVKEAKGSGSRISNELNGLVRNEASVLEAGDGASVPEKSERGRKKKKKKPVLAVEDHGLPDATNVEPVELCKKQETSDKGKSVQLSDLVRNEVSVLEKSEKKRKKKKNDESSNHASLVLDVEDHGLRDTTNVEPVESKKRKRSDIRESEELNSLVRNELSVVQKSERKKKKTNKDEQKKNEESSNHTSPVLDDEDHGLRDTTNFELVESKKRKSSEIRESEELNGLVQNELSVVQKSERKKKKTNKDEQKKNEESSNHTSPVLDDEDHGLQDTTSVEPMKESKKRKTSDSRNSGELNGLIKYEVSGLEKSEKKRKKKKTYKEEKRNEESNNQTSPVLAVEDHGHQDTTNIKRAKVQECSASGKPHELAGLAKNGASVSEGGNSSTVPDHNSCTTSKKRRLSSGNIRVTSENTQLAAENCSCKDSESNMQQANQVVTATDFNSPVLKNDRARPIYEPIWRGSISVKQGNIDGLVAHLSSLACYKVHEKASSLNPCLSPEMFPRLEIWPDSFLKNGPPTDESIALYFFPSGKSNDEKVYDSLVHEMKKNDLAMRCVLDNVELLLFTSYQLPMYCWNFNSKEYLWGIFRRRKTPQH